MALTPQTLFIFVLIFIVFYAGFSSRSLSKKVYCSFRGRDRTVIYKWAKVKQARIDFEDSGGVYWYNVSPKCVTHRLWANGIHAIIPISVKCLDYRWNSTEPLDPNTFTNDLTPDERKSLDIKDDVVGYTEGSRQAYEGKKKKSLLEGWLPIIMLIGIAALGYMVYQQQHRMDMLGLGQNVMEQQLNEILQRLK